MIDELRAMIDQALGRLLPRSSLAGNGSLNDAIRCAVYPGGKRMRPIFTLLAAHVAGVRPEMAMDVACAMEFLHCSSLVFDDLPCMDDAQMRRDCPALHRLFGESAALLAGLALMNEAYSLLARHPSLLREACRCIGADGMIGGQAADLSRAEADSSDRKTTELMRLTLTAGAIAGSASADSVAVLAECGERLGRAYQMLDDLVDAAGRTHYSWVREVADCRALLSSQFGMAANPLIAAIDAMFAGVAESGRVAA